MTDWATVAPRRAANAVKALGLLARTAGKDYDVPEVEAAVMLGQVRDAHDALVEAYGQIPLPGPPEAPAEPIEPEPKPRPVWRDPPHVLQIDQFVADLPPEHLSIYITHIVHRLCERAADRRAE